MISSNSPSRQGARTEFLVPNRGFWWWRRIGTLSGKMSNPSLFSGQGLYVAKGGLEAVAEAATPPLGAAWPGPRGQVVWAPRGSSPSRLLAP
jgi:hypothetical protein